MNRKSAATEQAMKGVQGGYTLLEVMIVVMLLGILAAIAVPSYGEYVKRGKRAEGQAALHEAAAREERYYAQNNVYITSAADIGKLGMKTSGSDVVSETAQYTLEVAGNGGGYTLTAVQQFGDTDCGNLTLNALGEKGRSGSDKTIEECWR